jgi:hypothetical protein
MSEILLLAVERTFPLPALEKKRFIPKNRTIVRPQVFDRIDFANSLID